MPAKILYVEDNTSNMALMREFFSSDAYEFLEARDSKTALKILDTAPVDLLLVDVNLPYIDGLTMVRHLRARPQFTDLPIIAVTAFQSQKECIEAGCDGFIPKPIMRADLLQMVDDLLKQQQNNLSE